MADKHVTGPIQVFVVGFDKFEATGRIMAELRRARKRGVIRLVDVIFVQKNRHGDIENSMHLTDLSEGERMRLGAIAGGLIGLHAGGVEGMVEGAELGALAVAERDAGLSVRPDAGARRLRSPRVPPRRSSSSSTTGPRTCATRSSTPAAEP